MKNEMTFLQGKKVLITRDASQTGSLKAMLMEDGMDVISVPTISIADPPSWQAFDKVASTIDEFDWMVFSSVNAVIKTRSRLSELCIDLTKTSNLKIAAVGDQTAKEIELSGWKASLIPDRFQAEDLLEKLLATNMAGKKIWIPRALKARAFLIEELEKADAVVVLTPVYQNVVPFENKELLATALKDEKLDWITFTSASTVKNFFNILNRPFLQEELPKLASIGSITTETLNEFSLVPAFTANPQNLMGLRQGIINWEKDHS